MTATRQPDLLPVPTVKRMGTAKDLAVPSWPVILSLFCEGSYGGVSGRERFDRSVS